MVDRQRTLEPLDLRYPGGKGLAGLAEWIVAHQPPHVFYAEPFAGKGGVFRHKPPALRSWLIDSDPEVIAWWNAQDAPGAIVTVGDGIRFAELAAEWGGPDLLCYYDPPYLPEVRTKRRCYRHELTREQHVRLLDAWSAHRCPAMVSGYWSELYADRLAGWRLVTREVITRGGVLRTECLWLNPACADPPSPGVSMQYSALGGNFRERERINRKLSRWSAKFRAMDSRERRAMLLALLDADRSGCRPRRRRR
jgi:DNA adenine methylase